MKCSTAISGSAWSSTGGAPDGTGLLDQINLNLTGATPCEAHPPLCGHRRSQRDRPGQRRLHRQFAVLLEPSGSQVAARKVSELGRRADLVAVADPDPP